MPRVAPPPAPPRMLRMRRGENSCALRRARRRPLAALSPRPFPRKRGRGRIRSRFGRPRAHDCACSPRRRTLGLCCRDFSRPSRAEASASVTAAAPGLVRVRGQILRPATGVLRASAARLGLRMTGCGVTRSSRRRTTLAPFPRAVCGGRTGDGGHPAEHPTRRNAPDPGVLPSHPAQFGRRKSASASQSARYYSATRGIALFWA
jgi:hypothetical protein